MPVADKKYLHIEIGFFLVYYFLFNILTDVEYGWHERHESLYFLTVIPTRLLYGAVYIIPFWICYKTIIQVYLFQKKYLAFSLLLALFLYMLNFYFKYSYWVIAHLSFLSPKLRLDAHTYYEADVMIHYSFIYILRELLVISALAYFIKSARQESLLHASQHEQLHAELNYLKAQIQPHFFFNTLNNIYALTLQRSDLAAPLVAKHAEMMRYILYDAASQRVSLQQEVLFLKNYSEVESVRYPNGIKICFDSQGINQTLFIEPLLLLPFVENAFKHGAGETVDKGYITIIVCVAGKELTMEVMNSKPVTSIPAVTKPGVGLQNVGKRLALLYPDRHNLAIKNGQHDFSVRLTMQLH